MFRELGNAVGREKRGMVVGGARSEPLCDDGEGCWGNDEGEEDDADEQVPGFW